MHATDGPEGHGTTLVGVVGLAGMSLGDRVPASRAGMLLGILVVGVVVIAVTCGGQRRRGTARVGRAVPLTSR